MSFTSPYEPDILRALERYAAQGVRVLGEVHFDKYSDPASVRLLGRAVELGMLILIHCDEPAETAAVARAMPQAPIIVAHFGASGFNSPYGFRHSIRAARPHKNLYVDTCGSLSDHGIVEEAVEALGPERVLFGTDFPILDVRVALARVFDARISDTVRQMILGRNITRLLKSAK